MTPTKATLDNTLAGYTVALVGRISGDIEQSVSAFQPNTPIPDGARLPDGSGVTLTYFETLEERDDALTDGGETQQLARFQGAGLIDLVFAAPTLDPTPDPPPRFTGIVLGQNVPFVPCDERPRGFCITRDGSLDDINIEDFSVASFGLGLAFTATLTDEIATTGEIDAFNSFDLEGLVMVDPNGAILEGLFITESGVDLTLDAFRPDFAIAVQPIPLPAGALLLPAALGALAMFRRRRAV